MSIAPPLPLGPQALSIVTCLVFPGLRSIRFVSFVFFDGGSAPYFLGALRQAYLACPWHYLARFLGIFQALPGVLFGLSPSWGDHLCLEISMASQTNCSWPLRLDSVCVLNLFIDFSWGTDWPAQGACRTQQNLLSQSSLFWEYVWCVWCPYHSLSYI